MAQLGYASLAMPLIQSTPKSLTIALLFSAALIVGCGEDSAPSSGGSGGAAGSGGTAGTGGVSGTGGAAGAGGSAGMGGSAGAGGLAGNGGGGGTGGVVLIEIDRDLTNAEVLPCDSFKSNQILMRRAEGVDYVVTCVMDVTANVLVQSGVTIAVEENGGIGVYNNGSFWAAGTAEQPVAIVGTTAQAGWWRGIHIESNLQQNVLDHVRIEDTGSNYVYCCNEAASILNKGGRMSLTNTTIRRGTGYGVVALAAGTFDAYASVRITQHAEAPLNIAWSRADELDGVGSDYSGNLDDFVELAGSSISSPARLRGLNVPYRSNDGVVDVIDTLTIDPGVDIAFGQDAGLGIYDDGSLTVDGTSSRPVVFRGTTPARGWWRGVHVETDDPSNRLQNLQVRHAGSNYVYCCNEVASLVLKQGRMSVVDTTVADGAGFGIYAGNAFSFGNFARNTITRHTAAPISLSVAHVDELDGVGSSFTSNDEDYIRIRNSNADNSVAWRKTDVPYFIDDGTVLDLKGRINIGAGTELVFGANSGLGVYDTGTFSVGGTALDKVTFRGLQDVQGYWRGIHTETNSIANVISHANIRNAGSNYVYCCNSFAGVYIGGGQMTIENSAITDSGGCAVTYRAVATFNESGNAYSNNAGGNVCAE